MATDGHELLDRSGLADDAALLAALRAGDGRAFAHLVDRHHVALVRVARQYVATREVAEDVAQDTWLGLLRGLDGFEGRSSLRTYLFRIAMNLARTRGVRETRSAPFSSLGRDDEHGPSIDPERFVQAPAVGAGHWISPIRPWGSSAEQIALSDEALQVVTGDSSAGPIHCELWLERLTRSALGMHLMGRLSNPPFARVLSLI
jgi:RNA polymerase sigma-70 factor (ECF subfamily)